MIKVLVADDSAFMRKAISMMIERDEEIKVIGLARNGQEAVEKVRLLKPDVLTLDIEMPVLDGLDVLRVLMKENPLPVLMISSLTKEGADATLEALSLGAADYIPKGLSYVSMDIVKLEQEIIAKIKSVAKRRSVFQRLSIQRKNYKPVIKTSGYKRKFPVIAIGSSTGGPGILQKLLTEIPKNIPSSILIAQHMPAGFTKTFSHRLDTLSKISVKEAEDGEKIKDGFAYIAPGNKQMSLKKNGAQIFISVTEEPSDTLYRPSVNFLISSVADIFGSSALSIILTGMGNDGLEGVRKLKKKNGYSIAQDESTSIIYGMPKAIVDSGLADKICPIDTMAAEILNLI